MRAFAPDLFVSIRFGKIFKEEIIEIPTMGVINLHSAILPDYRGVMGTLQAIIGGQSKIGCTLHTIPDRGIDTGEIISIAERDVDHNRSLLWNIIQLYPPGVRLITDALRRLETGTRPDARRQDLETGSYYSVPTATDFQRLAGAGMKLITAEDYLEVMAEFVFTNLSESSREDLSKRIQQAYQAHFSEAS